MTNDEKKSEIRNPKSETNPNIEARMLKASARQSSTESGRGQPHSKTLARNRGFLDVPAGFGVRLSSAAFGPRKVLDACGRAEDLQALSLKPLKRLKKAITCVPPELKLGVNERIAASLCDLCVKNASVCVLTFACLRLSPLPQHKPARCHR